MIGYLGTEGAGCQTLAESILRSVTPDRGSKIVGCLNDLEQTLRVPPVGSMQNVFQSVFSRIGGTTVVHQTIGGLVRHVSREGKGGSDGWARMGDGIYEENCKGLAHA